MLAALAPPIELSAKSIAHTHFQAAPRSRTRSREGVLLHKNGLSDNRRPRSCLQQIKSVAPLPPIPMSVTCRALFGRHARLNGAGDVDVSRSVADHAKLLPPLPCISRVRTNRLDKAHHFISFGRNEMMSSFYFLWKVK